jgi:hypothetical protein
MLRRYYDTDEGPQREVHSPKDLGANYESPGRDIGSRPILIEYVRAEG